MRHQPGTVIDGYEIIEPLGEGAYAETYKARQPSTGEVVIMKSINPSLFSDPAIFQRFRREREVAERVDHPNVVHSRGFSEHRDEPYLVLEYIEGENLRQRLATMRGEHPRRPVPLDVALRWGRQLASVVAYLGQRGIVHRDLKPENVMVTAEGDLKVIDFGTALLEGARRLTWKHLSDGLGTPDYMSPEQIQGERGDARSDVYAWGIIMYELLTGHVPYGGDNWMAVMAGHLTKNPAGIRSANRAVPPALEAVVLKAMRRYPDHRYQTGQDLLDDLGRLDTLDAAAFDLSPEPPMGGVASIESERGLWLFAAGVAVGFILLVAVVILLSVVLR